MKADPARGPYITTYTGQYFYLQDPQPEEVHILDIAHALSMTCRWGGHSRWFYSVAEHSWIVSRHVAGEAQKLGLLHDAAEAYVGDIVTPLKRLLGNISDIEAGIHSAICARFGISRQSSAVDEIDRRICVDEAHAMILQHGWLTPEWGRPINCSISFWQPEMSKYRFLERFQELFNEVL